MDTIAIHFKEINPLVICQNTLSKSIITDQFVLKIYLKSTGQYNVLTNSPIGKRRIYTIYTRTN